jgi:surface protein
MNLNGMTLIGGLILTQAPPPSGSMIMVVDTNLNTGSSNPYGVRTIRVPVQGTYNCVIDWGDGTTSTVSGSRPQPVGPGGAGYEEKTYAVDGIYTITITGTMTAFGNYFIVQNCLTQVVNWGNTGLTGMLGGFYGASSLASLPATPPPTTITNMGYMFGSCSNLNQNISSWNVSNVTNMEWMFYNCTSFNQNLSTWITGLTSQPSSFSQGANAVFADNGNNLKPFLSNGTTRINT